MQAAVAAAGGYSSRRDERAVGDPTSFDEWITALHHEFTRLGRDDWIDWPLDRVLLFWNEELERKAERHEAVQKHLANCETRKLRPRVVFSLPVD